MDISSLASSAVPSTFSRLHTLELRAHTGNLQGIIGSCRSLRNLKVANALLNSIVIDSSWLREVTLEACTIKELRLRTAGLASLSLRGSCLAGPVTTCSTLRATKYLDISGCTFEPTRTLTSIAISFPNLETVDVHLCTLLEAYAKLETLCLDECQLPETLTLRLPKLQLLSIIDVIGPQTVNVHCAALEELRLQTSLADPVGHIASISISSKAMHAIKWGSIFDLEHLTLVCPNLVEVHLLRCLALKDEALLNFNSPTQLGAGMHRSWVLRQLCLDGCEELQKVRLASNSLQHLSLDGCKQMQELDLDCPGLSHLGLDEAEQLCKVNLRQMPAEKLCLGACVSMERLTLVAANLQHLDLKGCGSLEWANLQCPDLQTLDLSFAKALPEPALQAILRQMPRLQNLALPVCSSLGPQILPSARLPHLTYLDLFSTPTKDLLALAELDVSYCPLSTQAICQLLGCGRRLTSIAISGCQGAQDEIWDVLDASHQAAANQTEGMTEGMPGHSDTLIDGAEPMMGAEGQSETALVPCHRLQTLACVGCKELTICRLGMHEAPCGDARAASSSSVWLPCPTKAAGLQTLRVGLSKIVRLALALPDLAQLDARGCGELTHLDLHCPVLLHTFFQSCRSLEDARLQSALHPGGGTSIVSQEEDSVGVEPNCEDMDTLE
ncbi:hypothetical protein WJX84_008811 [Apatococcus fuscideae]